MFLRQVSRNVRQGTWQADDGGVARSARSGCLACGCPPSRPASGSTSLPRPCHLGRTIARHRSSEILAWEAIAPAFDAHRIRPWPPRSDAFGGGGGCLRLGPVTWRGATLDRGPYRGRLSVPSCRRPFDAGRLAAGMAAAPHLGAAALQIRIALRATHCRVAAVLGRLGNFGAAASARDMDTPGPRMASVAVSRQPASSETGRQAIAVTFARSGRC
jgi:hypothetical protein